MARGETAKETKVLFKEEKKLSLFWEENINHHLLCPFL